MTRKLDIGRVFEGVLALYRQHALILLGAAAIIYLPLALLQAAAQTSDLAAILILLVPFLLAAIAGFVYQAAVVGAVAELRRGARELNLGEVLKAIAPRLLPLLGLGILASIAIAIGFLLLIIPGLILTTIWALLSPAILLERRGFDAFGRSQQLVSGNFWPVLGVIVIVVLIGAFVGFVLGFIGAAVGFVGYVLANLIASVLTAPLQALAISVMYFELLELKGEAPPGAAAPATVGAGPTAPAPGTTSVPPPAAAPPGSQPPPSEPPPSRPPPSQPPPSQPPPSQPPPSRPPPP